MTVKEMIARFEDLISHGMNPDSEVQAWDPDADEWFAVTGFTYGEDSPVRLYTDVD